MTRTVLLDTGPLGMATHRGGIDAVDACKRWLLALLASGARVVVPEIVDYELRRELLRAGKNTGIARLDALEGSLHYLPLTTAAMRHAAELWAQVRRQGMPTADPLALDVDVILAAQGLTMKTGSSDIVVATTNVGHLSRLIPAEPWERIPP